MKIVTGLMLAALAFAPFISDAGNHSDYRIHVSKNGVVKLNGETVTPAQLAQALDIAAQSNASIKYLGGHRAKRDTPLGRQVLKMINQRGLTLSRKQQAGVAGGVADESINNNQ